MNVFQKSSVVYQSALLMGLSPLFELNPENFLCWTERYEIFVGKWDKKMF